MTKLRDTYTIIRAGDLTPLRCGIWHVLYFDFDGTESTYATDLTLAEAKKLVKERNKRDPLPDAIMKHLSF